MEFGRRTLPQAVDYYAQTDPSRVYASIPESAVDLSNGFRDITMAKLAAVVSRLAWWLEGILGVGNLDAIAYIGPADIRYAAIFLAAVKCRYKVRDIGLPHQILRRHEVMYWHVMLILLTRFSQVLFISPRNHVVQNGNMIVRTGCRALFYAEELAPAAEALRGRQIPGVVIEPVPSLEELLLTPEDTKLYPYERSFDEARDEPCLILHSSGSTGKPRRHKSILGISMVDLPISR